MSDSDVDANVPDLPKLETVDIRHMNGAVQITITRDSTAGDLAEVGRMLIVWASMAPIGEGNTPDT